MVLVAIYAKQDSEWLVNGNKDKEGAVRDNKGGQRKMFGRRWRLRDCECCSSRCAWKVSRVGDLMSLVISENGGLRQLRLLQTSKVASTSRQLIK